MLSDKATEHICRLVDDSPPFTDDDLAALVNDSSARATQCRCIVSRSG